MSLAHKKCRPCEGDVPPLTDEEAGFYRQGLQPEWHLNAANRLQRSYAFKNFAAALAFLNRVASVAETENHHPHIVLDYNRLTLELWTHAIDGLSENDFILAGKIDRLTS